MNARLLEAGAIRVPPPHPLRCGALRENLKNFKGVPCADIPATVQAGLRPYQKDGFDFLCHLTQIRLGGILADDMGLGKTLQTLAWLAWMHERSSKKKNRGP